MSSLVWTGALGHIRFMSNIVLFVLLMYLLNGISESTAHVHCVDAESIVHHILDLLRYHSIY